MNRNRLRLGAFLLVGSASVGLIHAQAPQFEVISVKPSISGDSNPTIDAPVGGRLAARNVCVDWPIKFVWKLRWDQIFGGRGWIRSAKSDVEARAADPASHEDRLRQMPDGAPPYPAFRMSFDFHCTSGTAWTQASVGTRAGGVPGY
jgi:hypothetical protein